jgi:hypothetical protein
MVGARGLAVKEAQEGTPSHRCTPNPSRATPAEYV